MSESVSPDAILILRIKMFSTENLLIVNLIKHIAQK